MPDDAAAKPSTCPKLDDLLQEAVRLMEPSAKPLAVPTGFADLDTMLSGGFRPGELAYLASRPSAGKSSLAMQMAIAAAKTGCKVVFVSLEAEPATFTMRLLSLQSGVPMARMLSRQLTEDDWTAVLHACTDLGCTDFHIADRSSLTVEGIRACAMTTFGEAESERCIIFVDSLQFMQPSIVRRYDNRAAEVFELSRGLKALAMDLHMPVVVTCRLSRDIEKRSKADRTPKLSDLRESSSIEQDADVVMLLDRSMTEEEADSDDRPGLNEARLIVAKHRNGPIGSIMLSYETPGRFGDLFALPGSARLRFLHTDALFWEAAELVVAGHSAVPSAIQRELSVGYSQACRIMDQLEQRGIVGSAKAHAPRDVLATEADLKTIRHTEAARVARNALARAGLTPKDLSALSE